MQVDIQQDFMIRLTSVRDVEDFVASATNRPFPVFLSDGQHTVNGKSFMEMFCLVLTRPLTVITECDEENREQFRQAISRFLWKE